MARDVFLFDAKSGGYRVLHGLGILCGCPGDHFAIAIFGHSHRRFHRSMRQVRRIIFRLDDIAAFRKHRIDVADIANHFARLPRGRFERLAVSRRVVARVGTGLPFNFQTLASLESGPAIVGNDRNSAQRLERVRGLDGFEGQGLLNARNLKSSFVVV